MSDPANDFMNSCDAQTDIASHGLGALAGIGAGLAAWETGPGSLVAGEAAGAGASTLLENGGWHALCEGMLDGLQAVSPDPGSGSGPSEPVPTDAGSAWNDSGSWSAGANSEFTGSAPYEDGGVGGLASDSGSSFAESSSSGGDAASSSSSDGGSSGGADGGSSST